MTTSVWVFFIDLWKKDFLSIFDNSTVGYKDTWVGINNIGLNIGTIKDKTWVYSSNGQNVRFNNWDQTRITDPEYGYGDKHILNCAYMQGDPILSDLKY